MAEERTLKLKAEYDGTEVTEGVQQNKADVDGMADATSGLTAKLDQMTGGAVSGFKSMAGGLRTAVKGMKSLKVAMAATGIGLLVVAVGSLISYFKNTQKGAEKLEVISAALGAAFGIITDKVSYLGEAIFNAFTNPKEAIMGLADTIKSYVTDKVTALIDGLGLLGEAISAAFSGNFSEAADLASDGLTKIYVEANPVVDVMKGVAGAVESAAEGVVTLAQEVTAAAGKASALAEASIALRQSQRDLTVSFAEGRAAIKEYNKVAEDVTQPIEDRIAAAEKAIEIEQNLLNQRMANAEEELRIHQENMAITESTEEDYDKEAELIAMVANLRMESAEMQTTLQNKLNTIRKEYVTTLEAERAEEQKILDDTYARQEQLELALASQQEKEIAAVVAHYENLFALAEEFGYGEAELEQMQKDALKAINDKYRKEEEDADKEAEAKKVQRRQNTINQVNQMAQAAANLALTLLQNGDKEDKKTAKKRFQRAKKIQMGAAVMSTASAVAAALAAPPVGLGIPAGIPGSITAGITGAAQIATIAKQRFDSGGGETAPDAPSTPSAGSAPASVGETSVLPPQIDFSFLGEGSEQTGLRAYVVSENVTTAQQADQKISDQAAVT